MNESAEDYIKTIYILKNKGGSVHSIDIANELGFSKASVSIAMTNLKNKGIIVMEKNGNIEFTKKGKTLAKKIFNKYSMLINFLQNIAGVDEQTAREDACRIEHCLSESTYEGIKQYMNENIEPGG